MKRFSRFFIILLASAAVSFSCQKPEEEPEVVITPGPEISQEEKLARQEHLKALKYLKEDIMSKYYYWFDQMPKVSYTYKTDIFNFFASLLYSGDRWSWMMDGPTYINDEQGITEGTYGVALGQMIDHYKDYGVYVRYVYPDGPFDKAGVKRGWEIAKIDKKTTHMWLSTDADGFNDIFNYPSTTKPHIFTFKDQEGEIHEAEITATESLITRPGLLTKIFTAEDYPGLEEPVGYFNYLAFKAENDANGKSMLEDITEAMAYFKENNIKTLIFDVRYNGGGDARASELMMSYLAPPSALGKVYVKRVHNKNLRTWNESTKVTTPAEVIQYLKESRGIELVCTPDSPEFTSLYYITGHGSASASEMLLNGLKPLANVHHVGNVTYGKPNGMYVLPYPKNEDLDEDLSNLKYVFLPICFYNKNGEDVEIPEEGMTPDNQRPDDLYHDFTASEDNIAACLYHIVNGSYPDLPEAGTKTKSEGGVDARLNEWENDKNYGRFTDKIDF